jgi:hypothetical protein
MVDRRESLLISALFQPQVLQLILEFLSKEISSARLMYKFSKPIKLLWLEEEIKS